jgi:FkbM family methyltransferase
MSKLPPILPEQEFLYSLSGRILCQKLKTLYVIGAHGFDEKSIIDRIFPALEQIVLFEPLPELRAVLEGIAGLDSRVTVYPYAMSDENGMCEFRVTNNSGQSSSLLPLGTHQTIFPEVRVSQSFDVQTFRVDRFVEKFKVALPDVLIIDVQGAEYKVLSALGESVLGSVRLIYTEASTEAVYEGSRSLAEVEALLAPRFIQIGFSPLTSATPTHGNAVFVRAEDLDSAFRFTMSKHIRRAVRRAMRRFGIRCLV